MLRRLMSALLALTLFLTLTPAAHAAEGVTVYARDGGASAALSGKEYWRNGGETEAPQSVELPLFGWNLRVDTAVRTLILQNASIGTVRLPDGWTLRLEGASQVRGRVVCEGTLSIEGSGSLSITHTGTEKAPAALQAGTLRVKEGRLSVSVTQGEGAEKVYAIRTTEGDLTVEGGTVSASAQGEAAYGLLAEKTLTLQSGADISAQGVEKAVGLRGRSLRLQAPATVSVAATGEAQAAYASKDIDVSASCQLTAQGGEISHALAVSTGGDIALTLEEGAITVRTSGARDAAHAAVLAPGEGASLRLSGILGDAKPCVAEGSRTFGTDDAPFATAVTLRPAALSLSSATAKVGQALTVQSPGLGAVEFEWRRGKDGALAGVGSTYVPTEKDAGLTLVAQTLGDVALYSPAVTVEAAALPAVTEPAWSAVTKGLATWAEVEHAKGYLVQLYKNSWPVGEAQQATKGCDFLPLIKQNGAGRYAFTATAVGDGKAYLNGPASARSGDLDAQQPVFTEQPQSQTVNIGQRADFSAQTQEEALFQWESSADGAQWAAVTGATARTLSIDVTQAVNGLRYRCVATNAFGLTRVSQEAVLTAVQPFDPPAEGNALTGFTEGQVFSPADTLTFTAVTTPVTNAPRKGDRRYLPSSWTAGGRDGDFAQSLTQSFSAASLQGGGHLILATFQHQEWDGETWQDLREPDIKALRYEIQGEAGADRVYRTEPANQTHQKPIGVSEIPPKAPSGLTTRPLPGNEVQSA